MANEPTSAQPKHYFLNERHQLAPSDKEGGGGAPKVVGVDWKSHGAALSKSLCAMRQVRQQSDDPTTKGRLFVVAKPKDSISKASIAKKAVAGELPTRLDFAGKHSQILTRMGFDLVAVQEDGSAIVHATNTRIDQIDQSLGKLGDLSQREKNKWATLEEFSEIPLSYKTRASWWPLHEGAAILDAVVDFQPMLPQSEAELLISVIKKRLGEGEKLRRIGTEFTGRKWLGALLKYETIEILCRDFQAIYSIHPPMIALAASAKSTSGKRSSSAAKQSTSGVLEARQLPCVGVVDTGIPSDHLLLGNFRIGQLNGQDTPGEVQCSHGSLVASRVVFGEVSCTNGEPNEPLVAKCSIYDLRLGDSPRRIYEDSVGQAIAGVVESAPHVRVFNLSFDSQMSLDALEGGHRDKALRLMADLDNRAFALDIICVVAAGNSVAGVAPVKPYPNHFDESEWELRTWSRCFNAITCGGTSEELNDEGVATEAGGPSPFTRIGPGFANSRKPDFSASAGNTDASYQPKPGSGLGVWCCNDDGLWEDHAGTSYAAPLLAREAARTWAYLQTRCETGTRPFASLVKAVLGLSAKPPQLPHSYEKLAKRTLGFGSVCLEDVESTIAAKARFFWQGIIANEDEILTVELPIPGEWVKASKEPKLRLVCAWDTPVNSAVEHIWACRRVEVTLRALGNATAIKSPTRNTTGYPLIERVYDLTKHRNELEQTDACLLDLKYSHLEMAEYPAGILEFSSQQKIGLAYELYDASSEEVSPHGFVQSLPIAQSMNRLSTVVPATRHAVSIRSLI